MAPHLEQLCSFKPGVYPGLEGDVFLPISDTEHYSNIATDAAKKSHELAKKYPDKFREVADGDGEVCEGYDSATLQIRKAQPKNEAPGNLAEK